MVLFFKDLALQAHLVQLPRHILKVDGRGRTLEEVDLLDPDPCVARFVTITAIA